MVDYDINASTTSATGPAQEPCDGACGRCLINCAVRKSFPDRPTTHRPQPDRIAELEAQLRDLRSRLDATQYIVRATKAAFIECRKGQEREFKELTAALVEGYERIGISLQTAMTVAGEAYLEATEGKPPKPLPEDPETWTAKAIDG